MEYLTFSIIETNKYKLIYIVEDLEEKILVDTTSLVRIN